VIVTNTVRNEYASVVDVVGSGVMNVININQPITPTLKKTESFAEKGPIQSFHQPTKDPFILVDIVGGGVMNVINITHPSTSTLKKTWSCLNNIKDQIFQN